MNPNDLNDFKNWLSQNHEGLSNLFNTSEDKTSSNLIGKTAVAKVSLRKILERIECEEEAIDLADEFMEHGGTITDVQGKNLQIEVSGGIFLIPRFCVSLKD